METYPVHNKLVKLLGNMHCGVFCDRNFFARELISGKLGKNAFFLSKPVFLFFFFTFPVPQWIANQPSPKLVSFWSPSVKGTVYKRFLRPERSYMPIGRTFLQIMSNFFFAPKELQAREELMCPIFVGLRKHFFCFSQKRDTLVNFQLRKPISPKIFVPPVYFFRSILGKSLGYFLVEKISQFLSRRVISKKGRNNFPKFFPA